MSQLPSLTAEERMQLVKQCTEAKMAPAYIHEGFVSLLPLPKQALMHLNRVTRVFLSLLTFLTLDAELTTPGTYNSLSLSFSLVIYFC